MTTAEELARRYERVMFRAILRKNKLSYCLLFDTHGNEVNVTGVK